jgi:hypothetical protein
MPKMLHPAPILALFPQGWGGGGGGRVIGWTRGLASN